MNTLRNKVQLIGRLGAKVEVKTLESGKTLAHATLATNETYKNQKGEKVTETTWLRSISPALLASNTRWPSTVIGIGGPAFMPWLNGVVATSGTSRVCAGPAGRSTRLVSVCPLLLWICT